jgi:hypothetical protein
MADTDLRDFACPVCWGWLPDYPVHGERDTYCSRDCRAEAQDDVQDDDEDDV